MCLFLILALAAIVAHCVAKLQTLQVSRTEKYFIHYKHPLDYKELLQCFLDIFYIFKDLWIYLFIYGFCPTHGLK